MGSCHVGKILGKVPNIFEINYEQAHLWKGVTGKYDVIPPPLFIALLLTDTCTLYIVHCTLYNISNILSSASLQYTKPFAPTILATRS